MINNKTIFKVKSLEECLKIEPNLNRTSKSIIRKAQGIAADQYFPVNDIFKIGPYLIGRKYCEEFELESIDQK